MNISELFQTKYINHDILMFLLKKLFRFIFRNISQKLTGTGVSKNRVVYNMAENIKKHIKEDYVLIDDCKLLLD